MKARGKKGKKPTLRKDANGEFYYRQYFVRGKMKLEKIYVIDGIPVQEFYEQNADPITLLQDGEHELLQKLEDEGYWG
jgi:hypothetical protein